MPCWRCGAREVDPARGPSPWKRGVRAGNHVLVCPSCQGEHAWVDELDHCSSCGSWRLARQLGVVTCRECGTRIEADAEVPARSATAPAASASRPSSGSALAADVHAALARMWGKAEGR